MTNPENACPPVPTARSAAGAHVLRFEATWVALDEAAQALREIIKGTGAGPGHLHDIALAFDEGAINIVKYAQPTRDIELVVLRGAAENRLTFEDDGVAFDPPGQPAPPVAARRQDLRIGGLGLVLARHFASRLDYTRTPDHRNRFTVAIPTDGAGRGIGS